MTQVLNIDDFTCWRVFSCCFLYYFRLSNVYLLVKPHFKNTLLENALMVNYSDFSPIYKTLVSIILCFLLQIIIVFKVGRKIQWCFWGFGWFSGVKIANNYISLQAIEYCATVKMKVVEEKCFSKFIMMWPTWGIQVGSAMTVSVNWMGQRGGYSYES